VTTIAFILGLVPTIAFGVLDIWPIYGLFFGGLLVGLFAPSFRRALCFGLYLGLLVLLPFLALVVVVGSSGTPLSVPWTVASVLGLPIAGSSIRGLV
jgi:hypothetical protein